MKTFEHPFRSKKHSPAHVILVHALVVLTGLMPTPALADMLSANMGIGSSGAGTPASTAAASANAVDSAAAAANARANAQDMLTRNTLALQAVTAMQDAARAVAAAGANNLGANPNFTGQTLPDVPNGLATGGLEIIGAPVGATAPIQNVSSGHTTVNVTQTQQQAWLEWKTFNVGKDTTLAFDQSAGGSDVGTWIAFNHITDPSGNPTQILGSIQAQGQVYVINQNGIIFGGSSQVNTGSLVASALPINDNLVTRGLLNNPDSEFLFSATGVTGTVGDVTVQAGAKITAPTTSANVGGRVALIGPNATNKGTISTPDGQTILAAGLQVGFDAHKSEDPSLRGLDVYVGQVGSSGGSATNSGLIQAPRGSVVVTGKYVNQNGFIDSTTSAALNGRIDLLANYNAIPNTNYNASTPTLGNVFVYPSTNSTGIVRTAAGSVMQILPEYSSSFKVVGTELALKSQINMQGLAVYLGTDSVILAPNADVAISAGVWDLLLRTNLTDLDFVTSTGQVYLDHGAVVDVAGSTGVAASLYDYILTVDLRAAEFADSPLQRNSALRGASITVDLRRTGVRDDGTTWVGTPLADLTAYLGVIERNVGQLTVAGGTVSMAAGESVVMQDGSVVNVSGGYQDFSAGTVNTTRLIKDGNLVDIADAQRDVSYDGIYDPTVSVVDPRWGVTETTTGLFGATASSLPAYVQGASAGAVRVMAASMALDGVFSGNVVVGPQQISAAPAHASLALEFKAQQSSRSPLQLPFYSPSPPAIEFRSGSTSLPAADSFGLNGSGTPLTLRQERKDGVFLSPDLLTTQGFGLLVVDNSDGNIVIPAGVALTAPAGGGITLRGANIDVQGSITAPAGEIHLTAYDISPYATELISALGASGVIPPVDLSRGKVVIGGSAIVTTEGLTINNMNGSALSQTVPDGALFVADDGSTGSIQTFNGGSVVIEGYSIDLAAGSLLDVSGGLLAENGIAYGTAGTLTLHAGQDPLLGSIVGGHLTIGGTLRGYSGVPGGELSLRAPTIQIGGSTTFPNTLLLQAEFFSQGGFSSFSLSGIGTDTSGGAGQTFAPAIVLSSGTVVRPVVSQLVATTSSDGQVWLQTVVKPEGYRETTHLEFLAPGVRDFVSGLLQIRGDIQMQAASSIETDASGSVVFKGQTVDILGQILAPGGQISIIGAHSYATNLILPAGLATVHLGGGSILSTAGKTVYIADILGKRSGTVYAGGDIEISGSIVAETGSTLNVSGTSAVLDLLTSDAGQALSPQNSITQLTRAAQYVATRVDSNAGQITLLGGDFLFSEATLIGQKGGPTAQGGSLIIESDRFVASGSSRDDKDINLLVAQSMSSFVQPVLGTQVIGTALINSSGGGINGMGYFGVDSFTDGGFDSLKLGGNVQFNGAIDLTARGYLMVADGGILGADALVRLTAPYVSLGQALGQPIRDEELVNPYILSVPGVGDFSSVFSPTYGAGQLEVTADMVETGFLSLQGIGRASLTARQELRGSRYLDIAGQLTITAGQIYPVTASSFTITAYDYVTGGIATQGSVTIASSGITPAFPLSGGGRLNIYASSITQGGTLRAPFGTITLGWNGVGTAPVGLVTNTSVPVTQQITLKAGGNTSVSAIDPVTGKGVVIPYGIVKDGNLWIDPTGLDITSTGVPDKTIRVSALNVTTEAGSDIDIRGGGELYAYRWVEGNGGTQDVLASNDSFAILPGYDSQFAPFAPFATSGLFVTNLGGDPGYVNANLKAGDRIYLKGSTILAAGTYTLLPARYALLPGALLVTPSSDSPVDPYLEPSGAVLTSGYRFNNLNPNATSVIYQSFEVAPQSVVKARSEYTDYSAAIFIPAAQQSLSLPVSRTTLDAGYALLRAQQTMQLAGNIFASGSQTGRGGRVDVSSPLDIVLAAPGAPAQPGKLVLNSTLLSGWNAESLLIGGIRTFGTTSTTVTVRTNQLTVDNAGALLTGKEIILVANETITLAAGASITQSGNQASADSLVLNGNGALVRVSGVTSAQTSRTGVTTSSIPQLNVGAGVLISGSSITLDSSNGTSLDPATILSGQAINLSSGRVSVLLTNPGTLQANPGLVLGGTALASLQNTASLSLLSYSSLDLYGTGTLSNAGSLALHAGEIRGFNNSGGTVTLTAQSILLDNSGNGTVGAAGGLSGTLNVTAQAITIGQNALAVNRFANLNLNASAGILMQGSGSLLAQGNLNAVTPFFAATSNAQQKLTAGGVLTMTRPTGPQQTPTTLGLGAKVAFQASSIVADTDILLPSGLLTLQALTGSLNVTGRLDVGGVAQSFYDVVRYTDAGQISLIASSGNINLQTGSVLNLAAASGGGDAGLVSFSAAGVLDLQGTLLGDAGTDGVAGSVFVDVGSLGSFSTLNNKLNAGGFANEQNIRVRSGSLTIDGTVNAHHFFLSLDQGSITVNGTINATGQNAALLDASGNVTGTTPVSTSGAISLIASGNVTLNSGAVLTVAALDFDNAGKGGSVSLESGAQINGTVGTGRVSIHSGSIINLSVNSKVAGAVTTYGSSAFEGKFSGTLHIRAPQNSTFTDVLVDPVDGTIIDASSISLEGYRLYSYNEANVTIQAGPINITGVTTLKTSVLKSDADTFFGTANGNVNYNAMLSRLLANNTGLQSVAVIMPGIEIVNRGGSIVLGSTVTAGSAAISDWDLSTFRFGPKSAPGVLTLRAAGNLEFYNTLSDGFTVAGTFLSEFGTPTSIPIVERMWMARLTDQNTNLPTNTQSWSYRLTAGANLGAASFREVTPLSSLATDKGSLLLGQNALQAVPTGTTGNNALTRRAINPSNSTVTSGNPTTSNRFQVIRTGTGDIEISAGRDVQLLNQFATIYSAGVSVVNPTKVVAANDFILPKMVYATGEAPSQGTTLGAVQQLYPAQYSMAGGNVFVSAQQNIIHLTKTATTGGTTIADSSRELPNNWLMRRGYVDPATGQYGYLTDFEDFITQVNDPSASTSWWIDFSNFFDGIAALGGGNVVLKAGNDVENVSAHAPTNARAAMGTPDPSRFLELGGGDVTVIAGHNISGGVYYVERGSGTLTAGGSITTNATRSPSLGLLASSSGAYDDPATWLPTTLFLGKSTFDLSARGDLLMGPAANTFLLPQGLNNKHWYKTYFSTLSSDSAVNASSLGGTITIRQAGTLVDATTPLPMLELWLRKELVLSNTSAARYQPWLRLAETDVTPFDVFASLMPASLRVTSFSGSINVVGTMNLSPSPSGTLELLAAGSITGLNKTGASRTILSGSTNNVWSSAEINLSDANPDSIAGIFSPYSYYNFLNGNSDNTLFRSTNNTFLNQSKTIFAETGSTSGSAGVVQAKQVLHAAGILHLYDLEPARIYAGSGDVSGITLFASKASQILAGRDITDIGLYIQNVRETDVSVVASGRDLIAYNANSLSRVQAVSTGNLPASSEKPNTGDIQINGPGTLQVLIGRDINLGTGSNNSDGTGVGITSIGNGRNPYLPFEGADIILAAGMGKAAVGLGGTNADFTSFITDFATGPASTRYLTELAELLGVPSVDINDPALTAEQQKQLALAIFYLALRDAGRDHNDPDSPYAGTYTQGYDAIASLFPVTSPGSIQTQARDIKTKSGGNISILAPDGGLQLAATLIGETLAPPGIITEAGGNISVFTKGDVNIGIARIFTLRGGDIMIWSSEGDIAAGSSAKTVQSAPPTRVLIDPQSANVVTDLAGLATGGGIGVLATVAGVRPGNVDLIAPIGAVDAGDAGIRATGNLNIAATVVLNSANISVGGTSAGTPAAPSVASPSLGGLASAASSAGAASNSVAQNQAAAQGTQEVATQELPSVITVEVIGYGGGSGDEDERRRNQPGE